MENDHAKIGIKEILSKLSDQDAIDLANTTTQGLLKSKVTNISDAVELIIKYSPNLQTILRRKVVTKDTIFEYLHENNVPVTLPVTKNDLIDYVLNYWNYPALLQTSTETTIETNDSRQLETKDDPEISAMAIQFVEWFYTMMNLDQPIDTVHFWTDSKLKLNLISGVEIINNTIETVEEIVGQLFATKCEHNLYFHPNLLSEGVQGRRDPHGLVVVLSCGTLLSNNMCVGVYEQVFMLARDPYSDNNWKIKSTELNLRSKSNVCNPPSLCDSNLTNALLGLPNS